MAGCDLIDLAGEFGTPLLVFDEYMDLDVATRGELPVALPAGVPAERLVFRRETHEDLLTRDVV